MVLEKEGYILLFISQSEENMTTSLASQFNYFQFQLVRYELPFIMVIGTLGNIANVVVFMRRNLRSNACSWYLAIISLMHIVLLYASCLPRIMAAWSGYDYVDLY